jgi:hypothetical protein
MLLLQRIIEIFTWKCSVIGKIWKNDLNWMTFLGWQKKCIFYLQRILFDSLMIICRWCANLVTVINGPLVPLFFRKLELTFPFIEGTEGDNMRGDGCRSIIIHLPVRCTTSKLSCCLILFYDWIKRDKPCSLWRVELLDFKMCYIAKALMTHIQTVLPCVYQ